MSAQDELVALVALVAPFAEALIKVMAERTRENERELARNKDYSRRFELLEVLIENTAQRRDVIPEDASRFVATVDAMLDALEGGNGAGHAPTERAPPAAQA